MGDLVERLERLSKLKADGLLSEDEFARAKQQLLVAPAPAAATSASAEVDEEERAAAVRQLRDRRRAANTKRRGGARSGGSAAASDLAAELSAAAAGVGARPQPPLPTIPAQFIASPGKPWTFKRAMSVCLVAIASVSFTLRILQGVRLLLACGDVDFVEQPMRCRAVATLVAPPFFTLAVVVIGRCFAVGEDTRVLVERFWKHFLPPQWMAALKRNILGGHVADVVAAQHAPAAMRYDGGDLTTLMKGMSAAYAQEPKGSKRRRSAREPRHASRYRSVDSGTGTEDQYGERDDGDS